MPHQSQRSGFAGVYVRTMLGLLPLLVSIGSRTSKRIARETEYLPAGFSFALTVEGTGLSCACEKSPSGAWRRLNRNERMLAACTYVISFRDRDYAYRVFNGSMSLQDALAARLFSTQGPNNTGVSLTYLFTAILRTFFGWRAAYRKG